MMNYAYNQSFLPSAQLCMAEMMNYVSLDLNMDLEQFMDLFLISGLADAFGRGCAKYVLGMSGYELAKEVFYETHFPDPQVEPGYHFVPKEDYWCGWVLAYTQWYTGMRFAEILQAMDIKTIRSSYWPLHEAPEDKFVDVLLDAMHESREHLLHQTHLQRLRKYYRLTQAELSAKSGVSLRSIQMYEQRNKDINKAQVTTILSLAHTLHCLPEELIEA